MKHKHHIIPKHMGGTDDPSNLIELTVKEHAESHLKLYEKHGKHEDLCAYYMLSGNIEEFRKIYSKIGGLAAYEKRKEKNIAHLPFFGSNLSPQQKYEICSNGGKVQGKINSENGHMKTIQKLADSVSAGKKGGKKTIELKKGSFGNPEERKKVASLGGKVQGKINGKNGHCKKISLEYWQKVKDGKIRRIKRMWITNGIESKLIICGEKIDDGWRQGKIQTKKI